MTKNKRLFTTSLQNLLLERGITVYKVILKIGMLSPWEMQEWYRKVAGKKTMTPDELDIFICGVNDLATSTGRKYKEIQIKDVKYETKRLRVI